MISAHQDRDFVEDRFARLEAALRAQAAVLDAANFSIVFTRADGLIEGMNLAAERWLRYRADELVGRATLETIHDREEIVRRAEQLHIPPGIEALIAKARQGQPDEQEWTYVRKDGTRFSVLVSITPRRSKAGEINGFLAIAQDISERKAAQAERAHLASIVECCNDGIVTTALDGTIRSWNPAATTLLGWTAEEMIGRPSQNGWRELLERALDEIKRGKRYTYETVRMRKDGGAVELSVTVSPLYDGQGKLAGLSSILHDVRDRKESERRLSALREKDLLLKEVHHRVKNNLQVVASLLSLQARRVQDSEAKEMFRETQARVRSIALLHERLYQSKDLAHIDLSAYLREVASGLQHAHAGGAEVDLRLAPLSVGLDGAIPCGLILNELVTNAFKHARATHIRVTLEHEQGRARLSVDDDGVGLPVKFDPGACRSVGMQVVQSLAEQLGGALEIGPGPGARFRVVFPCP